MKTSRSSDDVMNVWYNHVIQNNYPKQLVLLSAQSIIVTDNLFSFKDA